VTEGIVELDAGIQMIDTQMSGIDGLVAAFVVPGENPAVIETGPATVTDTLTDRLTELGLGPGDIAYFVMSHIHLDHAGAAGHIIERFPNATVVVHEAGARHMADPARLMASAARVFGEKLAVFGELRPVPADRIMAVSPGAVLDLGGGRTLEIVQAEGHAIHHMAVLDSASGGIFVGDSMGVFLPEAGVLRPATPPPDFNLAHALATLERFSEREPKALYLSHFGPAPTDRDLLAEAAERLTRYGDIIREEMRASTDVDVLADRLRARTLDDYAAVRDRPDLLEKFEALNAWRSSAAGYLRYFQTRA
jgi:glyoxylase-like metal-dependent hydrolase (beta-lactamase superfamily II)